MSSLASTQGAVWAAMLMIALPIVIIAVGELQERLRQRDSEYAGVVRVLRDWVIPLAAFWAVVYGLFDRPADSLLVRIAGTGVILALAAAALVVVRIVVARLRGRALRAEGGRIPQILLALPRVLVLIAAGWLLLDAVWGVNLSAAMTALGVGSLVVSFALQDTLSGLASGLLLLADSPFQPGDWIRAGDIEGRVVDINWRSSRIVDRNGDLLVVPNAELAGGTVVNFDSPERLHRIVVPVQVAYANPPTLAKEMLLDAARSTEGVLAEPPPKARVVQIDDPLMGYEVDLWVSDYTIVPRVVSDFGSLVWYSSHRRDVPLPSPAYDVYMWDGVQTALSSKPDRAELHRRLRTSPLIDALDEDDVDRLATGAQAVRFAQGERFLRAGEADRDLYVIWEGTAQLVVPTTEGRDLIIAELRAGDVFGILHSSERWTIPPAVIAITDCEIVRVKASVAGDVASRNPTLAEALNQVAMSRQRRLDRIEEQLAANGHQSPPGGDTPSEETGERTLAGDGGSPT